MAQDFQIPQLISGGLITNYNCPSRCRHCLYNCGPLRDRDYIQPDRAHDLFTAAKSLGAAAMHIGGGEPMMQPKSLGRVLEAAGDAGMAIDYVETNSAWYRDEEQACSILLDLRQKGLRTLLVSISPFHMEYIPFAKVRGVTSACQQSGISIFPWMESFVPDIMMFDTKKNHCFDTLLDTFGKSYLSAIRSRYWIHMGGRAINTFRPLYSPVSLNRILDSAEPSCAAQLSDTSHFHMDLKDNYVPGLCAGLAIAVKDLDHPLDPETYPVITRLAQEGVRGLFEYAAATAGFADDGQTCIHKCDLCNKIRLYLFDRQLHLNELAPAGYYRKGTST